MSTESFETLVNLQATPNPNAWKYILNKPVLNDGKATYSSPEEAAQNLLARSLFEIQGVRQVHFFQNVITLTFYFDVEAETLHSSVISVIQSRLPAHNPNQTVLDEKKKAREHLSPDIQKIEEILDRTVRPGLQGDGGDIAILRYEDNKLHVFYEGACGTCPSSTTGTLMAIESILRDEFNPQIEVIPAGQ
jgi:Fe-S cluster biogenesis protein NfuA